MLKIKGAYGSERHTLKPNTWVNIWLIDYTGACSEWLDCLRVSDLTDEWLSKQESKDWDDYGLEPCNEHGELIKLNLAFKEEAPFQENKTSTKQWFSAPTKTIQ